jgi:hypothetical protein
MTEVHEKTDDAANVSAQLSELFTSSLNSGKKIDIEKAESYKEEGNKAFKGIYRSISTNPRHQNQFDILFILFLDFLEQHFDRAIEFYTLAIENNPNDPIYYGNRSFAYIKSEFYGQLMNL